MKDLYKDGISEKFMIKMEDYGTLVDEFIQAKTKSTTKKIVEYLNDKKCTVTPGLALRRHLCNKFGKETDTGYSFTLSNGKVINVGKYTDDNYDVQKDELNEYTEIFAYYNEKYNTDESGQLVSDITNAEARRLLKVTTSFSREKMFEISFALHMDSVDMFKFLTDYLAEPTYNYRNPYELIAFYCHTHDEVNNYADYHRIVKEYDKKAADEAVADEGKEIDYFTKFARSQFHNEINTEEKLYEFLLENKANFNGYSRTAYKAFMDLYNKALAKTQYQALSNETHIDNQYADNMDEQKKNIEHAYKSTMLRDVDNNDQLAKIMLSIPRSTQKKYKSDGTYETVSDFINVTNTSTSKKKQTTLLSKSITEKLPMRGRLDKLVSRKIPVERKDLVIFKFYLFCIEISEIEEKFEEENKKFRLTTSLANAFIDECNNMLINCGMSRLYPSNRFDNLILLCLYSDHPYEFFETIIEYSFIYEEEHFDIGERGRKKKSDVDDDLI